MRFIFLTLFFLLLAAWICGFVLFHVAGRDIACSAPLSWPAYRLVY